MLKHLSAASVLCLGIACAAPAAGAQDAGASAAQAAHLATIWVVMIFGFVGAGALLRHERRLRRARPVLA